MKHLNLLIARFVEPDAFPRQRLFRGARSAGTIAIVIAVATLIALVLS